MWILTKSEWPTLVNLSLVAHVDYQQVGKNDPRTRVLAITAEREIVLADCDTGEQARAVILLLAEQLREGKPLLDLSRLDLSRLPGGAEPPDEAGWV